MTNPATKRAVDEHNALKEHWSAHFSSNLDLNHSASDHTYKHHIAQLMTIYTDTEQKLVDFNFKTKAVQVPMTALYGTKGYRSTGPEIQKIYQKRETRWDNRMCLTENLNILKSTKKKEKQIRVRESTTIGGTQGESLDLGQSNSSILLPGNSSVLLPAESNRPHSQPMPLGVSQSQSQSRGRGKSRSRSNSPAQRPGSPAGYGAGNGNGDAFGDTFRTANNRYIGPYSDRSAAQNASADSYGSTEYLDSSASFSAVEEPAEVAESLILQGLYRFDCDQEVDIYNKFVLMLTNFDSHDMLLILQDAFKDAKTATMLDSYGGTGRPFNEEGPKQRGRSRGHSHSNSHKRVSSSGERGARSEDIDPNAVNINKKDYVFSKAHKPHGGLRL